MPISPIFVSQDDQLQFANTTKLRDLDSFEEFFWLIAQSANMSHSVVVDVIGPTTVEQWWEAMEAVQTRYPLLSASIRKIPGKRPFFERVEGASMPFRLSPLPGSMVLEQEMEIELEKSFGDGSGPLTRATLFHAPDRSVIIFTTYHSSLDGKSHLLLVQDLLAHVAGEELGKPLEVQPGLAQLLGLPAPIEYAKNIGGRLKVAKSELELAPVRVQRLQLSVEETSALVERAKKEGTTVHTALIVALALAGQRYCEKWNVEPIRCMSPIDMRKALKIPGAPGLLIGAHSGSVPIREGASFWSMARTVKKDMLATHGIDGARQLMGALSSMVAEEHNPNDLYSSVINGPLMHELMVTNYAGYKVRTLYGNLKIDNLFTGSPSVTAPLQKVSVLTLNGRLGMTLVARDLFPNMLDDAREILLNASRD